MGEEFETTSFSFLALSTKEGEKKTKFETGEDNQKRYKSSTKRKWTAIYGATVIFHMTRQFIGWMYF